MIDFDSQRSSWAAASMVRRALRTASTRMKGETEAIRGSFGKLLRPVLHARVRRTTDIEAGKGFREPLDTNVRRAIAIEATNRWLHATPDADYLRRLPRNQEFLIRFGLT
jgi:hypothetical protein